MTVDGARRWITYDSLEGNTDDFETLGAAFGETGRERVGWVGRAPARLMSQRALVDFAVGWMNQHRV